MIKNQHPQSLEKAPKQISYSNKISISRSFLTRLIITSTTLVVSIAAYFSYQTVRNMALENLKGNAMFEVKRGVDDVDNWLATLKAKIDILANTGPVQSLDWSIAGPYLLAEQKRIEVFASLGLAQADGWRDITTTTKRINVGDRQWFAKAMSGLIYVDDPIIARVTGKPVIAIGAPVRDRAESVRYPIGVIFCTISIERVAQAINQIKYGKNSYAFALNSKGQVIVHPDQTLMSTVEKPGPSLMNSSDQDLATIALQMVDRKEAINLVNIDGKDYYVSFSPLQEANWSIALAIPRENIESQLRPLDLIAMVVLGLAGTLIGVLWYVQSSEQTQLKKSKQAADVSKEAANAANQAKSDFLANMSHELRTPLNGILGYAQILNRSKVLPDKERHGVEIIYQCGSHLLTLINDILDLSKIEARKLELVPKAIHFPSFLQGVVEICRVRSDQKGIDFIYHPEANLPTGIEADEKRLRQVLLNLLGNAIKFTDSGSVTLKIEVNEPSLDIPIPRIKFQVEDTGVGISSNEVNKIFQAFEQVGEQKRQSEGTGLGLAISQRIVELMGGQIQVKSELGVGSNFYFEVALPSASDWAQQNSVNKGRTIIGYEGAARHILIVDDRWENRSVLANLLEPMGFIITEAENGQEGLNKAKKRLPDLIIADIAMPVMDGFEMLKQLRADSNLKDLRVIVSSASVAEIDRQMSEAAGGDDFLAKPVDAVELFALLALHLQLTWQYDEIEVDPALSKNQLSSAELIVPPAADLQILLELAEDGLLKELVATVEEIGTKDDRYQPFIQQIQQLAKQFKTEKIELLIQKYLTNQDN
ncbi:MAG: response regulator [Oscillatoriales cyanobacterium]|nr:MAG: response regulator [Oscillatoriales cyanobacterium]TAH15592.1 MAG: response regulator [Oscillatoriales cyanobacterium]